MARADPARAGLTIRCAIYTRKSSDEGLEQEFNSLDAQREACEDYIVSHGDLPPFATLNRISDALRIPKSHLLRELVLRATARQMLT